MHALSWGGKMFGSFTNNEVEIVRAWIDSLDTPESDTYRSFTGRSIIALGNLDSKRDFISQIPQNESLGGPRLPAKLNLPLASTPSREFNTLNTGIVLDPESDPLWAKLLPLWFTHPCLLESIPAVPWRTTTAIGCAVVRLLRAQYGFSSEAPIVAGIDESTRTDSIDLVDIGRGIIKELGEPMPNDLHEVMESWPSDFAVTMLRLSAQPNQYLNVLLGLTQAFVHLHQAMSDSRYLSEQHQKALKDIADREQQHLNICIDQIKRADSSFAEFVWGYGLGRGEIEKCLK